MDSDFQAVEMGPQHPNKTTPASYEGRQDCEKEAELWDKILKSEYSPNFPELESAQSSNNLIQSVFSALKPKSSATADYSSVTTPRTVHRFGVAATVKFIADPASPFTGLFQGADCGIIRLSLLGDPFENHASTPTAVAPGLALKLFATGKPSANVAAISSLGGQGKNANFFALELSNMVQPAASPSGVAPASFFDATSKFPNFVGLQNFGKYSSSGDLAQNPKYPFRLYFVPTETFRTEIRKDRDFRDDLIAIPEGSTIYEVWGTDPQSYGQTNARASVSRLLDATRIDRKSAIKIGDVITKSPFIASHFGDANLLFDLLPYAED
jgi:hypothetical protein